MVRVVTGDDYTLIGALLRQLKVTGAFFALLNALLARRWYGDVHATANFFPFERAYTVGVFVLDLDCGFVCGAQSREKLVASWRRNIRAVTSLDVVGGGRLARQSLASLRDRCSGRASRMRGAVSHCAVDVCYNCEGTLAVKHRQLVRPRAPLSVVICPSNLRVTCHQYNLKYKPSTYRIFPKGS